MKSVPKQQIISYSHVLVKKAHQNLSSLLLLLVYSAVILGQCLIGCIAMKVFPIPI